MRFSKSDSLGLDRFRDSSSLPVLVISKERNEIVVQRCRKLGLEVVHGVADKPKVIESLLRDRGLTWKSVGYIGNDVNDLSAMKQAELSFCPSDSPAVVKSAATYILNNAGGNGAVREFFDLLIEFGGSKGPR